MHIITAVVRTLHKLEADLGLPKNTLVTRLTGRVQNLCSSLDTKHSTLMSFRRNSTCPREHVLSCFEPNYNTNSAVPQHHAAAVLCLILCQPVKFVPIHRFVGSDYQLMLGLAQSSHSTLELYVQCHVTLIGRAYCLSGLVHFPHLTELTPGFSFHLSWLPRRCRHMKINC